MSSLKFYSLMVFVAAFMSLCALLTMGLALNAYQSYVARHTWTQTEGTIAAASLAPCPSGPPQQEVRYVYHAGGADYSVQYGVRCDRQTHRRFKDARFQSGATAHVYFNPLQPGQSWLDTGPEDVRFGLAVTGGMASLTSGLSWLLLAAMRRRRRIGRLLFSQLPR